MTDVDNMPLIANKDLPVTRENLGLGPRAEPGDVALVKGKIEDYKFDLERQKAIQQEKVLEEHKKYLESHTELKQIVSDLMCALMQDQPNDVYQYCADYFGCTK